MKELALDVSFWDNHVPYEEWKSRHGLWGVIVKAGGNERSLGRYRDSMFDENYRAAKAAGLHVGAYYYTVSTNTADAEADARHFAGLLEGKQFDLPVYMDVEDPAQFELSRRALTDVIKTFCDTLAARRFKPGIYTGGNAWLNNVYHEELLQYADWIAWWRGEWPHEAGDVGMWQQGTMRLSDGSIYYDDVSGCTDVDWCCVDYPAQIMRDGLNGYGGGGQVVTRRINCAERAALIHYDMVEDDRNGYSQAPVRWGGDFGGEKTVHLAGGDVTYALGSYDCSSSVCKAWQLALVGSPYEGALDGATYTGNMREVFVGSGLFYADRTPAKRGDVYLNDGAHTAMCQDGGLGDGPFGYDCLSHFRGNEWGGITDGEPGDQTGGEARIQEFYEAWSTTLHYNGGADWDERSEPVVPVQLPGEPENDAGLQYQAHVQGVGWLEPVRDGQCAGTVGFGMRLEAIRVTPPEGWVLSVRAHVQGVGWVSYDGIGHEGCMVGTVGESRRIEDLIVEVLKRPAGDRRKLWFCVHQQDIGWKAWTPEGSASGTDGMGIRLEAVRMALR